MKTKIILLMTIGLLFSSLTALASDPDASFYHKFSIEFKADTARVEQNIRVALDKGYTTLGMVNASVQANEEYDKLLNKYYKTLMSILTDDEKVYAREAQRSWMKMRDAEYDLITALHVKSDGTIWAIIASDSRLQITRDRVFQLVRYIQFGDLMER